MTWQVEDIYYIFNSLKPTQIDSQSTDDIFVCILCYENRCILIKISLKFFPRVSIGWSNVQAPEQTLQTHLCVTRPRWVNSLIPGKFESNLRKEIFKLTLVNGGWGISYEIALRWMPLHLTDKSTLVQVMAWCHQATSHYLSQCWPRSLSPYDVTRPQWVNTQKPLHTLPSRKSFRCVFCKYVGGKLWCYTGTILCMCPAKGRCLSLGTYTKWSLWYKEVFLCC